MSCVLMKPHLKPNEPARCEIVSLLKWFPSISYSEGITFSKSKKKKNIMGLLKKQVNGALNATTPQMLQMSMGGNDFQSGGSVIVCFALYINKKNTRLV